MADKPLKSAYELAMERLEKSDRAHGVETTRSLTEAQKKEIARLRQDAKAKMAELEILHGKQRAAAEAEGDPEKLAKLAEEYDIDRRRVESNLESSVARVKRQD